jgi:hypothetical protein
MGSNEAASTIRNNHNDVDSHDVLVDTSLMFQNTALLALAGNVREHQKIFNSDLSTSKVERC